ncbi:MAG: hypothetical protein BWY56_02226 [Acidobacteria bacterium ADurb.Bin340]|nr:MAG: hypothetical protein BWY56_02226 [Acidobacteria bacterium ADurb.Bin340]
MEAPGPHGHAGAHRLPRLLRVAVEDEAVDPAAVDEVAHLLERIRVVLPAPVLRACGEGLGAHKLQGIGVGDGRGHLAATVIHTPAHPELGHRNVASPAGDQLVEPRIAVGLHGQHHPVAVGKLRVMPEVTVGEQVTDGLAVVPQEALRLLQTIHHAARERRQEGQQFVPATGLELLGHLLGPVLAVHLVTVDEDVVEDLARERPDLLNQLAQHALKMGFRGLLAHLVAFQASPGI